MDYITQMLEQISLDILSLRGFIAMYDFIISHSNYLRLIMIDPLMRYSVSEYCCSCWRLQNIFFFWHAHTSLFEYACNGTYVTHL